MKEGTMSARGSNILFADADGATVMSEVEALEKSLEKAACPDTDQVVANCAKHGLAIGSRAHLQQQVTVVVFL